MNAAAEAEAPSETAHKGRILVVDDDRLVLATVTHGLAEAGYDVIDADNGDDAILLAREHRPELALLDIRMEGKSGLDVAQTLRDAYGIPFMFLSAFADEATLAAVNSLGAMAYLVKPLEVGQIVPAVEAVIGRVRSGHTVASVRSVASVGSVPSVPPGAPAADPLSDPVPLALGVLMHRHSLPRAEALRRLHKLAADNRVGIAAQAERLLGAVEELARTA